MAIIIPSKSIYDKETPKIIDNAIGEIEVVAQTIEKTKQEGTSVYSAKINVENLGTPDGAMIYAYSEGNHPYNTYKYFSYVGVLNRYKQTYTIRIPRVGNNKYITYLEWFKNNEEYEILQSIQGVKRTGTANLSYTATRAGLSDDSISVNTDNIQYNEQNAYSQAYQIPKKIEHTWEYSPPNLSVTASLNFGENGNIGTASPTVNENEYIFTLEVYVGYTVIKLQDYFGYPSGANTVSKTATALYEKYEPQQVEFSFTGGTIGIDLKEQILRISSANSSNISKKTHQVESNELMQVDNYFEKKVNVGGYSLVVENESEKKYKLILYRVEDIFVDYLDGEELKSFVIPSRSGSAIFVSNNYPVIQKVYRKETINNDIKNKFSKTQEEYSNGKETATIRCSIADYYEADKDGFPTSNKIISIDKSTGRMIFAEGDEVIPMVYGFDGKDRPMSKYKNGMPKKFKVLGVKPYYNGAVWQELYLQEIYQ